MRGMQIKIVNKKCLAASGKPAVYVHTFGMSPTIELRTRNHIVKKLQT